MQKFKSLFLSCVFSLVALCFTTTGFGKELNTFKVVGQDKEPITMGWIYDKNRGWHINALFKDGIVDCFFYQSPSSENGLGLSKVNMPYRIEFTHLPTNQFLSTDNISYGQTANGDVYFVTTMKGMSDSSGIDNSVIVSLDENPRKGTSSVSYIIFRI